MAQATGRLPPGTCFDPAPLPSPNHLPGTSITLNQMFKIVGGICWGVTVLGSLLIFASHLKWRAAYREQSPLMRITLLPLLYATLSYASLWSYEVAGILNPISKLYVAYCVTSYFNYMVETLLPHHDHARREDFFIKSERRRFFGQSKKHPHGSLRWWRFNCVICYLALFVNLICFVTTEAVGQTYCKTSDSFANAILILNVITAVFTILGLAALPRMWWRFRDEHYAKTAVLRRFATFKPYVAIIVMQSFILGIIDYVKAVEPTQYMSSADFQNGVPGFMICCWSFIFIWGFIYTLSGRSYRDADVRDGEPVWKYVLYWAFPRDIFVGAWVATVYAVSLLVPGKKFDYRGGRLDEKTIIEQETAVEDNVSKDRGMSDSSADSGLQKDREEADLA